MSIKLTAYRPSYTDEFGEHEERVSEWEPEIDAGFHSNCYVITQNWRGKYYVKECTVLSYWYTGHWGWRMMNGWCFSAEDYGKSVFPRNELQKAIEVCEKKNRTRKVRVKYL